MLGAQDGQPLPQNFGLKSNFGHVFHGVLKDLELA